MYPPEKSGRPTTQSALRMKPTEKKRQNKITIMIRPIKVTKKSIKKIERDRENCPKYLQIYHRHIGHISGPVMAPCVSGNN